MANSETTHKINRIDLVLCLYCSQLCIEMRNYRHLFVDFSIKINFLMKFSLHSTPNTVMYNSIEWVYEYSKTHFRYPLEQSTKFNWKTRTRYCNMLTLHKHYQVMHFSVQFCGCVCCFIHVILHTDLFQPHQAVHLQLDSLSWLRNPEKWENMSNKQLRAQNAHTQKQLKVPIERRCVITR